MITIEVKGVWKTSEDLRVYLTKIINYEKLEIKNFNTKFSYM